MSVEIRSRTLDGFLINRVDTPEGSYKSMLSQYTGMIVIGECLGSHPLTGEHLGANIYRAPLDPYITHPSNKQLEELMHSGNLYAQLKPWFSTVIDEFRPNGEPCKVIARSMPEVPITKGLMRLFIED